MRLLPISKKCTPLYDVIPDSQGVEDNIETIAVGVHPLDYLVPYILGGRG